MVRWIRVCFDSRGRRLGWQICIGGLATLAGLLIHVVFRLKNGGVLLSKHLVRRGGFTMHGFDEVWYDCTPGMIQQSRGSLVCLFKQVGSAVRTWLYKHLG